MKIIVASNNKNKLKEIKAVLKDFNLEVVTLKEAGISSDPEETGKTFKENAYLKAKAAWDIIKEKKTKGWKETFVLADDSGLAVDYLKGAPGVYSARFAGEPANDAANNEKLLKELAGVAMEDRKAQFHCHLVLLGAKTEIHALGRADGYIIEEAKGFEGFGYDPIFFSDDLAKTFAEASSLEKNTVSHRAKALKALRAKLEKEGWAQR